MIRLDHPLPLVLVLAMTLPLTGCSRTQQANEVASTAGAGSIETGARRLGKMLQEAARVDDALLWRAGMRKFYPNGVPPDAKPPHREWPVYRIVTRIPILTTHDGYLPELQTTSFAWEPAGGPKGSILVPINVSLWQAEAGAPVTFSVGFAYPGVGDRAGTRLQDSISFEDFDLDGCNHPNDEFLDAAKLGGPEDTRYQTTEPARSNSFVSARVDPERCSELISEVVSWMVASLETAATQWPGHRAQYASEADALESWNGEGVIHLLSARSSHPDVWRAPGDLFHRDSRDLRRWREDWLGTLPAAYTDPL